MSSPHLPLPDLQDLSEAMCRGLPDLAIGGIVPGARALVPAAIDRAFFAGGRTLIIVPHAAEAEEFAAVLALLRPDLRTGVVPEDLASIYQGVEPPLASRLEAVRLLDLIARDEIDLIVVPARALLAPIARPSSVEVTTLRLSPGQEIDTVDLAHGLAVAGYRRVDLVEEAGDCAIRGSVIDVHTGGETAFRLEMDDLRIDRIRRFDPTDQRGVEGDVEALEILPLDLFPFSDDRTDRLAALLESEFPALASQIRSGVERRLWWGACHLLESEALSWLDLGSSLIVCDRDEVLGEMERWFKVQGREWRTQDERGVHLPDPSRLLIDTEGLRVQIEKPDLRIERLEVGDGTTRWWRLQTHPIESFVRRIPDLVPNIRRRRAEDFVQILAVATEGEERRFTQLLEGGEVVPVDGIPGPNEVSICRCGVREGFIWDGGLAVYGRRSLTAVPRPRPRRKGIAAFTSDLRDLKPGDLVVHMDHGIGRFTGFRRVAVEGRHTEMLSLEYQAGDSLMVPVERADLIQKYASGEVESHPKLDRLGGATWARRKARVKKAVREMAAELLRLAAVRRAATGFAFSPDSPWQKEFEQAFAWELTTDQAQAVVDIKGDLESSRPMDRLLCGDVGFGKTEVAIRAAFKAVLDGKQVAVLAPTTILVEQHMETFRERMTGFPVEVEMLSRFVSPARSKEIVQELKDGRIDIVIGTHRLLAGGVQFRDLGLVILDEEQRFGVAQKERLKKMRTEVDVLAMSATPIPRTLNMAFSGLRDISLIETPPRDRQAVETTVLEFSEDIVREAILHELERAGQVFFVHNRVRSIGAIAQWLRTVVPEARVVVAHGQMGERELEKAMHAFYEHEADVLLATAIIENGLDIPNANTLLVNRADRFGLAQLYQLRGRVGRSDRMAHSLFLVPPGQTLSDSARARLAAVQEFCELGAGFRIAARDLEIRGAGNMLGAEQHGFMEAVGFETYCRLLEESIAELEGRESPVRREVELKLGLDVQLPGDFIPEPALRLSFYKRLAACDDDEALVDLLHEIVDRYGAAPPQLDNLAAGQQLRIAARAARIISIMRRSGVWRLRLDGEAAPPAALAQVLGTVPGARITPTGEITLPDDGGQLGARELRDLLVALVA
ncbi:MAG: transcription-repair coupling factor [Acidobacteria bacterium]|nr:MAG: transcription-repair coupling factor [Acidobacteriota bacterium]